MIKNLALVVLFLGLTGVAWYLEGGKNSDFLKGEIAAKDAVFNEDLSQVSQINLPNASLVRDDKGWLVKEIGYPANQDKVKLLLDKLAAIAKVKEIQPPAQGIEQFFSYQNHDIELITSQGKFKARLGDVSQVTGNFYFQVAREKGTKLYAAKDLSFFEGVYRNELDAALRKYLELKALVEGAPFAFAEKRLFSQISLEHLKSVKVDNKINRWFLLDFENNATEPRPPGAIKTKTDLRKSANLDSVVFSRFVDRKDNILSNFLSSLELLHGNEVFQAQVYGAMNGRKGLFAVFSERPDLIFLLEDKGKDIFFENVQSFWDKRPSLDVPKEWERIDFALGPSLENMAQFAVEDLESFEVLPKGEGRITGPSYFNLVFNALFGLQGFEQALLANPLSQKELDQELQDAQNKVFVSLFGKNFAFALKDGQLRLYDLKERLVLVYSVPAQIKALNAGLFFAFK